MNVEAYSVDAQNQSSLTKVLVRGTGMGGGIGSVLYTEDSTGTVTATTDYEAFGKVVSSTGSSTENRKFCTKERDFSTGLDNFGFRYFDWELGRFITRDPSGYPDGSNNYLYCSNNPINFIDPLGLSTLEEDNKRFEEGEANFGNYRSNMPNRKKLPDLKGTIRETISSNLRDVSNNTKSQSTAFITSLSADIMDMSPSPEEVVKQTTIHAVKTVKNKGVVDGGKQLAGESYEVAKEAAGTNDIVKAFDFSDEYSWKEQAIYGASGLAKTAFIVTGGVQGLRKLGKAPKSKAYRAIDPQFTKSTIDDGFYRSGAAGRLGNDGIYANSTVKGAIKEFQYHNPGVNPTVFEANYPAGSTLKVSPPTGNFYIESPLPFTKGANVLSAPSLRQPGSINYLIRNGTTTGRIVQ